MAEKTKTVTKGEATAYFLRRNWQILYAVLLIVLVPLSIAANTHFVVQRFTDTADKELQRHAVIVGLMLGATSQEVLDDQTKLQQRIEDVAKAVTEVRTLDILSKEGEDFKVAASLSKEAIGLTAHDNLYALAWYNNQSLATSTASGRPAGLDQKLTPEEARSGERFWKVTAPLTDKDGKIKYLFSAKLSTQFFAQKIMDNLFWSYAWLIVTIFIVILLLLANTRMFEYAVLFRKLKEVDQMKDDFISMASHELRAPITAIRGYLSLFLEDAFGVLEDKPKSVIKTTFAISTHLAGLVEDLLEVSRIEQGRMSLNLEAVQPEEVVAEIVEQLHFEAERKGLTFEFRRPAEPLPKLMVDRGRLKQVLINFCSNAIKYTPKGNVTVTAVVKDGNQVEIKVTDTGLGMSAEAREKLFTKFYRIRTMATSAIPGTGLGLWITKQIVELMKGKIFVDSIEKVGTQISAIFPAIVEKKPAAPEPATSAMPPASPAPPQSPTQSPPADQSQKL